LLPGFLEQKSLFFNISQGGDEIYLYLWLILFQRFLYSVLLPAFGGAEILDKEKILRDLMKLTF